MSTSVSTEPRIRSLSVTDDEIIASLLDGRTISVPLAWSWRLSQATREERGNYRLTGNGEGVHWPDLDEDISAHGMLHGVPAPPPRQTA